MQDYVKAEKILNVMISKGEATRILENKQFEYYDKKGNQLATIFDIGDETFVFIESDSLLELINKDGVNYEN